MRKKIITSLLVSPLAFGALANINVADIEGYEGLKPTGWGSNSVSGDLLLKQDGTTVKGSVGIGTITQEVKVPCKGSYTVPFTTTSESGKITINVSGATNVKTTDGVVTFDVAAEGTVTFEVASANAAEGFEFSTGALQINYDFKDAQAKMNADLLKVSTISTVTANPDEKAYPAAATLKKDLEAQRAKLLANDPAIAKIQTQIDAIKETGDADKDLATYVDNKLYDNPNSIQAEINALLEQSKSLSAKIDNFNTNYPALVGLDGGFDTLKKDLDAEQTRMSAATVTASAEAADLSDEDKTGAANYVNSTCAANYNTALAALNAYRAEIDAAYADLTAKVEFKPTKDATAVQTDITTLAGTVTAAYQSVADYSAVYGGKGWIATLDTTATDAEDTILAIHSVDVPRLGEVWSIQQVEWLKEVTDAQDAANKELNKTDFANATKSKANNSAAYTTADSKIADVVKRAQALEADQNGAAKDALDAYDTVDAAFEAAAKAEAVAHYYEAVGQAVPADYTNKVNAVNTALDALMGVIKKEYAKLDLSADDYSTQLADADAAVKSLKAWTDAIQPKLDAQTALDKFVKYLKDNQAILANDEIPADFLETKFKNNIDALQNAVIAVTDNTSSGKVISSIGENKTLAKNLIEALETAYTAYKEFHNQIGWLQQNCNKNKLVDGTTKYDTTALDNDITTYNDQDTEWSAEYVRVAGIANPNDCYEAAKDLGDEIDGYDWKTKINTTFATYINGLTAADYNCVKTALDKIETVIPSLKDTVKYPADKNGNPTSPYLKALATYNGAITTGYNAAIALAATDKDAKLGACNQVIADLQALWNSINGMYQNALDYEELSGLIDAQLGTPLTDLKAVAADYSSSEAYPAYQKLIKGLEDGLDALQTSLDTQRDALTVTANKAATQVAIDDYKAKNGSNGSIANTIRENESLHNAELEAAKGAQTKIIQALAAIQENGGAAEFATEWIEQLSSLRDNDLANANEAVAAAYADCDCAAQNSDLIDEYQRIIDEVTKIMNSFAGEWDSVVKTTNDGYLNSDAWKNLQIEMNNVYLEAIRAFNSYGNLNEGYMDTDLYDEVVTNNAALFDFAAKYRKLINTVSETVDNATYVEHKALTQAEFDEIATEKGEAIIQEMKYAAIDMINDFNKAAIAYYTVLHPQAKYALDETATDLLKGYGYTAEQITAILADYNKQLADAEKAYATAVAVTSDLDNYKKTVGYALGDKNGIADVLDGIIAFNLNEQVIKHDWTPTYKGYDFAALEAELKTYENNEAIADIYKEQLAIFNSEKDAAEKQNENIGKIGNLLSDNLIDDQKDELEDHYEAAEAAVKAVKDAAQYAQTVSDFDDALATDQADLTALEKIITLYGPASQKVSITAAKTAVTTFNTTLGNFKQPGTSLTKDDVSTVQNAAERAINNVFTNAKLKEDEYLVGGNEVKEEASLLNILKVAYNDAYEKDPENVAAKYLDGVTKCVEDQKTLAAIASPAKYYDAAKAIEDAAAEYIVALQGIVSEGQSNPLQDAINSFKDAYDVAVDKVDAAQLILNRYNDSMVIEEYSPKYDTLLQELAAVQTAFDGLGALRIVDGPDCENQLAAITAKIAGIQNDIAIAEANAQIYNTEKSTWDALDKQVKALETEAQKYDVYGRFAPTIEDLKQQSQNILATLDILYQSRKLTEGWRPATKEFTNQLELTTLQVKKQIAYVIDESTNKELTDAFAWLKEIVDNDIKIIPGFAGETGSVSDVLNSIKQAFNKNNQALGKYAVSDYIGTNEDGTPKDNYDGGLKDINGIIAEYQRISDEIAALRENVSNATYQLGDLNNDGEVSIGDVQIMRQLILSAKPNENIIEKLVAEGEIRMAYAANIVGDDNITVADYAALINIFLNESATSAPKKAPRATYAGVRNAVEAEGYINVTAVAEENGIRTYAVEISDPAMFVAGQIDFIVESTSSIVDVRGADRLANHEVAIGQNDSSTRVLITSLDNAEFVDNQGVVLYIDVDGHSGLGYENAIFADASAQAYTFAAKGTDTSGIDSVIEGAKAVKEAIYDAAGRLKNRIGRGLNIIRNSDGSVTKEMHK